MQEKNKVTIVIPVYNGEKYLEDTLNSLLNQTYNDYEVYILDNCSIDNTCSIAKRYVNKYNIFNYIVNSENIGAENNFNKAFTLGTGEYIAIYHSDDIYHDEIIKKSVEKLKNDEVCAVSCMSNLINKNNEVFKKQSFPKGFDFEKSYSHDQLFKSVLKYGNFIVCPSVMMKRDIVEKTNKFNFNMFKTSSDLGLWLNIAEYGKFAFLGTNLINYRMHSEQVSYKESLKLKLPDIFRVVKYYYRNSKDNNQVLYYKFILKYTTKLCKKLNEKNKRFLYKKLKNINLNMIKYILKREFDIKTIRYFFKNIF